MLKDGDGNIALDLFWDAYSGGDLNWIFCTKVVAIILHLAGQWETWTSQMGSKTSIDVACKRSTHRMGHQCKPSRQAASEEEGAVSPNHNVNGAHDS